MSSSDPIAASAPAVAAPAAATAAPVRAAIARAAQATGVDFTYLLAQAQLESGLNPAARAATSSATGLYQFTKATWAQTLAKHGADLGLPGGAGVSAAFGDPATRARLMALRGDPSASAMMAADLAGDNQVALTNQLGRPPSSAELYLAHFLGSDGAGKFLAALNTDPAQSAAALLPRAAASNAAIFHDASGQPRSVGAVMALIKGRMDGALQASGTGDITDPLETALAGEYGGTPPTIAAPQSFGGPIAQEFAQAQAQAGAGSDAPQTTGSMADTLAAAFALGGGNDAASPAPAFVRAAYSQLRSLGF